MTRQHFQAVADAVNAIQSRPPTVPQSDMYLAGRSETVTMIAAQLAINLSAFNPRFDKKKFIEACLGNRTK